MPTHILDTFALRSCCTHADLVDFEHFKFRGIQRAFLRRYPNATALLGVVGATVGIGVFFLARAAIKSPDVVWDRKTNPEPWNEYRHKRYHLFHFTDDFPDCPAPEF